MSRNPILVDYSNLGTYLKTIHAQLYKFQVECIAFGRKRKRVIIESGMGSGKTLMCLTTVFLEEPQKILVLCSKNALHTWYKEVDKWFPDYADPKLHMVISGKHTKAKRAKMWERNSLFYVTTYATFLSDRETIGRTRWDAIIADEAHKGGFRNSKTQGFNAFKELSEDVPMVILTSGTLTSRGPQDLWGYLHILDRKMFSSKWKFLNTFCIIVQGQFGKMIAGVQNTSGLEQLTRPYLYRIPKAITDKALPDIVRDTIPVEMTAKQLKAYTSMDTDNIVYADDGTFELASTSLSRDLKLRQILACPMVCGVTDHGAGIEIVIDKLEEREDYHCVIFTPFREAVEHFEAYLKEHVTKDVFHLWGGTEPEELAATIAAFKQTRGIMVCTTLFAQSFELETAKLCFHIGYDWDQNNNFQAEARLRRITSTPDPVFSYYIVHEGAEIDTHMMEVLGMKTKNVRVMNQDIDARKRKQLLPDVQ